MELIHGPLMICGKDTDKMKKNLRTDIKCIIVFRPFGPQTFSLAGVYPMQLWLHVPGAVG